MKKKDKEQLKTKSVLELGNLVRDAKEQIAKLRVEKSQNKMKNLRAIFLERKKIALYLTMINEKGRMEKLAEVEKAKNTKVKRSKK